MMNLTRSRSLAVFVAASLGCGGGSPAGPLTGVAGNGQLEAALEVVRENRDVPALAAALVYERQVIEMSAVGLRAAGSPEAVMTGDLWHIGSLTKAMTATLAARLVERGEIAWSTTVGDVFPDLVTRMRAEYVQVTFDQLMYHTSGLPVDFQTAIWSTLRSDPSPLPVQRRRWAAELLALQPETSRGTHLYTNAGYIVAGSMMEEITGETWEELMRREVFEPLGMSVAGFGAPGSAALVDQPRGHVRQGSAWLPLSPGPQADNPPAIGPAGTVHVTLADYSRYMAAHVAGARGGAGLVSSESFLKLHTPAPGTDYSLGWAVTERNWANGGVITHGGSNGYWFATVWIGPQRDLAMFAVANAGGDPGQRATDEAVQVLIARFEALF